MAFKEMEKAEKSAFLAKVPEKTAKEEKAGLPQPRLKTRQGSEHTFIGKNAAHLAEKELLKPEYSQETADKFRGLVRTAL